MCDSEVRKFASFIPGDITRWYLIYNVLGYYIVWIFTFEDPALYIETIS